MGWLWLLLACGGGKETPPPVIAVALPEGRTLDPRLDGAGDIEFVLAAESASTCTFTAEAQGPGGLVVPLTLDAGGETGRWDGRDADGVPFDPGPAAIVVTATCEDGSAASTAEPVWILRLGIGTVNFGGVKDKTGADPHVPLAFHKLDLVTPGVTVIPEDLPEYRAVHVDDPGGQPLPPVEPWADPDMPPFEAAPPDTLSYNLPAAYVAGTAPRLVVAPVATAIAIRGGAEIPAIPEGAPDLRLVVEGGTTEGNWVVGTRVAVDLEPLPDTLGRDDLSLTWSWEAYENGAWMTVPGTATTVHRVYRLAGQPVLRDGTEIGAAPAVAWVGALDDLAPAVQGVPAESAAVLDAIRDWIHLNPYVVYNPNDAAYSGYEGEYIYWEYAWSDLTEWLDRREGVELYCHSVSCLFSVLAGTEGIEAPQQVLGVGFYTNLTRAAGTEDWVRWSFNSHSLVSPDGGATLWDASVDLDGDGDPANLPAEAVAPKGMSYEQYTTLLTSDPIDIVNSGLCYVY